MTFQGTVQMVQRYRSTGATERRAYAFTASITAHGLAVGTMRDKR